MFKVIFSQDTDITPKEAVEMQAMKMRPAGGLGVMRIGVEPCAEITVGFIWPCGTLTVGGCIERSFTGEAAVLARLMQKEGREAPTEVKLDPEKDMDTIQQLVFLDSKGETGRK